MAGDRRYVEPLVIVPFEVLDRLIPSHARGDRFDLKAMFYAAHEGASPSEAFAAGWWRVLRPKAQEPAIEVVEVR